MPNISFVSDKQKEPPVAKKNDRASPTKKTPPSRSGATGGGAPATHLGEGRVTPGPGMGGDMATRPHTGAATRGENPTLERKYRDKLTAQVRLVDNRTILISFN